MELDFITLTASIGSVFAFYKAVCWVLDRYSIGDKRKLYRVMGEGVRNNMREIIRMNHHQHCDLDGWIDEESLQHIEHTFECYTALGGNGTAKRWIEELRKLPREKEV